MFSQEFIHDTYLRTKNFIKLISVFLQPYIARIFACNYILNHARTRSKNASGIFSLKIYSDAAIRLCFLAEKQKFRGDIDEI